MTKSLYKVLFLTVATTALSIIPTFAAEEPLKGTGATVTHPVKSHHDLLKEMHAEWEKVEGGLKDAFSPAHLAAFQKLLNEAAGMTEIGLSVAAAADPKNAALKKAAAGIGAGVGVVNTVTTDLTQPGGVTAASAAKTAEDLEAGVGALAGQVGGKKGAVVAKDTAEAEDATKVLLGTSGVPTAASALRAGAAIASDVGGKDGTTAAAVLSAVSAAEQAQQGVQTAVNSASPLPPAAPPSSPADK